MTSPSAAITDQPVSVAVVIPAYNRARFLPTALASVLAQTTPANEIIVVDDGSTDDTYAVAQTFAPAVRVIRNRNGGHGQNKPLNIGVEATSAELVTLLDSDDYLHHSCIAHHVNAYRACREVGIISSNFQQQCVESGVIAENEPVFVRECIDKCRIGRHSYMMTAHTAYTLIARGNFLRSCTGTTFPRRVWQQIGGFDESIRTSTDVNLFFRVFRRFPLIYVDAVLRTLVRHADNVSQASLRHAFRPSLYLDMQSILRRELSNPESEEARQALRMSLRQWTLELAYESRRAGMYIGALRASWRHILEGGSPLRSALEIAKVLYSISAVSTNRAQPCMGQKHTA